jgi:hypothetical protein
MERAPMDEFVGSHAVPPEVDGEGDGQRSANRVHEAEHGEPHVGFAAKVRLGLCLGGRRGTFAAFATLAALEQHHVRLGAHDTHDMLTTAPGDRL